MNIGVLALQGNFSANYKKILEFGETPIYVKNKKDLFKCDGLIIPGGESTVMSKMLDFNDLRQSLYDLKDKISFMGICAGMVLLSKTNNYNNLKTLSIMNFKVKRNGYGRQVHSFNKKINLLINDKDINACFIRAPKVSEFSNDIKCLGKLNQDPVLLTDGKHLVSAFHPEYSDGYEIYEYFKKLIETA